MVEGGVDECLSYVIAASSAENEAICLDRAGNTVEAIKLYEVCETELASAISTAFSYHADDHPKLVQHRKEVLDRIQHLRSLKGAPSTISVEEHIKAVQLGMQASAVAKDGVAKGAGVKTLAACAAIGAAGGFLVLGSIPLVPASAAAVAGAAGVGYCATRSDRIGGAARGMGGVVVAGAEKVVEINKEHRISEKVVGASKKAVDRARDVDTKFGISTKVVAGVTGAMSKAKDIEDRHQVTGRVASGVTKGYAKVSAALDGFGRRSSAGKVPSAPSSSSNERS
mmetsp:Transcript_85630/g.239174  ORF Transcript_85630/g.239174 Transcript_85630/m.239174 type:complete len:283 (-) Transcript_85630:109-957(-)